MVKYSNYPHLQLEIFYKRGTVLKKLLLILICTTLLLSACGKAEPQDKTFRWVSAFKETTINPHDSAAMGNYEVVDLIQVSLYRWAPAESRDKIYLTPALAEGEPTSTDGRTWIIKVNKNAKWQNGEAITAETFIYSWRMGLDPNLYYAHASKLANETVEVEGAYAYYNQLNDGAAIEWDTVGLKVIDSHTLEIRTTQVYTAQDVMRHFSTRMTGPVFEALYEAGMNAGRTATDYGSELDRFMGCGPFKLTAWVKGSSRVFAKNEHFIAQGTVKLSGIDCRVVTDSGTRLQLFEAGESDYVALEGAAVEKYIEHPQLVSYDQKTVRTLEVNRLNPGHPVLGDTGLRHALYLAIDRAALAGLTYTTAAPYFISTLAYSFPDGTAYRQMEAANAWLPSNAGYQPELAKTLFEEALARHGLERLDLTMVYPGDDADSLKVLSEYLQSALPSVLGADKLSIQLQSMPKQAANDLMRKGDQATWDLCWSGYNLSAETFEPHKKFAPYVTGDSRNWTAYDNAYLNTKYGDLLTETYRLDPQATFELTVEIEKSIILDDVTCIPVVQERSYVLYDSRVKLALNTNIPPLGFGWEYMDITE